MQRRFLVFMVSFHRHCTRKLRESSRWGISILLLLLHIQIGYSACEVGDHWTWRNPLPQGNDLGSVTWNGTQFVAVGAAGTILTSPDGAEWTGQNSGTVVDLAGVVWGDTQFVAVGKSGALLTSPDGVSWTERNSGAPPDLAAVAWSGTQFVAVGAAGTLLTSPDAVNWTARNSGTTLGLAAVAWSGTQFVAVGAAGTLLTSPDGVNWTAQNSGTTADLRGIAWNGNLFVAVGTQYDTSSFVRGRDGVTITSTDGVNWAKSPLNHNLRSVAWNGVQFVAVGGYPADCISSPPVSCYPDAAVILTSCDGEAWTQQTLDWNAILSSVIWGNSGYIAVGNAGSILESPDGVTWLAKTSRIMSSATFLGYPALVGIVWSGTQFVAVGGASSILTSPDASQWTLQTNNLGSLGNLGSIAWSGNLFVAQGLIPWQIHENVVMTSLDGMTWTSQISPARIYEMFMIEQRGIVWSDTQFVSVGDAGTILTSRDGMIWDTQYSGTSNDLTSVAWSGTGFVATGESGTILTSPDGMIWIAQDSGTSHKLFGVTWNGRQLVAVGESGTILTSPDGVTWFARNSGTSQGLYAVAWGGSRFVAVGDAGKILASTDGRTWVAQHAGTSLGLYAVAWSGMHLVAVGAAGTILSNSITNPGCQSLSVAVSGWGSVVSDLQGMHCSAGTCSAVYPEGSMVNLSPIPHGSSVFTGWGGACEGTDICRVRMDTAKSVTAAFGFPASNLKLTMRGRHRVMHGRKALYRLKIKNLGPGNADGVRVDMLLPAGANLADGRSDARCSQHGDIVYCQIGALSHGDASRLKIALTYAKFGRFVAQAQATALNADSIQANNVAKVVTRVK